MSVEIDESRSHPVIIVSKGPTALQCIDHIPLLSTVSGVARVVFGALEATVGVVAFPIQVVQKIFTHDTRSFILINGIGDIVRGSVASVPIIGNIALYLYDHR